MSEKQFYATAKQCKFLAGNQRFKAFVGGRGAAKSDTIGKQDRIRLDLMPRAKSFLAGPYFGQVITKTLPSYLESLKMMNLREYDLKRGYGHYVVFKKPPDDWPKPYMEVRDYSKVITFANGYTKEILSLYGADSGRGGSYDAGDVDEAALCAKEDIDRVLMPSLRGNLFRFDHPIHYQLCLYSSPPWLPAGQYVYDYEELQKDFPDEYLFVESRTRDNKAISELQIKQMERTLPKMVYEVEVEGKRISKLPNGYYPTFNPSRHVVFDTTRHAFDDKNSLWLPTDDFLDHSKPLEISCDFNAAFTSLIVGQMIGNEQRIDNNLYVKPKEVSTGEELKSLVRELTELFVKTYAHNSTHHVIIYGDRNGNNKSPNAGQTSYEQIRQVLKENKWSCEIKVADTNQDHKTRHFAIEEILSEAQANYPKVRINGNKCKYLTYSIQNAPITKDWKKNKSSEVSEAIAQEKATHLSDCFDYLIYCKFARLVGLSPISYIAPITI